MTKKVKRHLKNAVNELGEAMEDGMDIVAHKAKKEMDELSDDMSEAYREMKRKMDNN